MLNESCIDLVKTNKSVSPVKRVNGKLEPMKRIYKTSDVFEISNMAEGVITEYIESKKLIGIKACIEYQIRHAKFKNYLGPFPLKSEKVFQYPGESERKQISLLADSLIATVIMYRIQLNEHHSNLSSIVFSELNAGLEWCLYWASRGISLSASSNEHISTFKKEEVEQYIN
ncbi:MAG: hypothetical protein R3273_11865 [Pseudidiomarina maritima]|nr:hypothetical protein [Pseudidiomarina maritima]